MSSILRALKKVQNESPGRYEFRPWPRHIYAQDESGKSPGLLLSNKFFLFSCLVLAIAIGIGWNVFDKREQSPGKSPVPVNSHFAADQEKKNDAKMRAVSNSGAFKKGAIEKKWPQSFTENNVDGRAYEFKTKTGRPEPYPGDPADNIMELNDPNITLQAIIWANNPRDRVAVINGNFIGERGVVEDFRVTAILRANVLLRDNNNESWRLAYRPH